ncbi:MAG: polymer-forming cytoskeletal protein, partial [Desulfatibacillaceae bacterium]|nr:polymer-forming cytoskeletal protein [Desulfatibacillaceae bacterium]
QNQFFNAFIGKGCCFEGRLVFDDMVRVDGELKGEVTSEKGLLVVGEQGLVDARVRVARLLAAGRVKGRVDAAQKVEIQKTGLVDADIASPVLTLESGAVFTGRVCVEEMSASPEKSLPQEKNPA